MGLEDKIKNAATDLGGKAKEAFGKVTGDKDTEAEGKMDQVEAKVKDFVADAGDKLEDLKDKASEGAGKLGANIKAAAEKIKDSFDGDK